MNAYIIAGFRSAVGKAPRGKFRFTRPDDLAANVIKHLMASVPNLAPEQVDDVIVGNATPEAEQGLNKLTVQMGRVRWHGKAPGRIQADRDRLLAATGLINLRRTATALTLELALQGGLAII